MELYETGGFCFSCNYFAPLNELYSAGYTSSVKKNPTDIPKELEYIKSLPLQRIRGLFWHADDRGFYVLWPDGSYFKKRMFNNTPRYIAPRKVTPPLYLHKVCPHDLVIVEGEINARSLYASGATHASIASTGGVSQLTKFLTEYMKYNILAIVVDKDAPGVASGVKLKNELIKRGQRPVLVATEQDVNEIFEEKGPEGVREWWAMEMPARMQKR